MIVVPIAIQSSEATTATIGNGAAGVVVSVTVVIPINQSIPSI